MDGRTTTHRVSEGTMIWEILDDWMIELDIMISFNGKVVGMHDTMSDIGVGHDCTLRCTERLRAGAQRFQQPQPDIPGQWTCSACGQERAWPVRNRCFRCGFPKGHDPAPSPYAVGPTGRPLQRSNLVNPTYRPNQRPPKQVAPTASVQNLSPLNQPVPVGLVDAAVSGSVPAFPRGNLDWLKNILQQILSPEDCLKYKSSFEPSPQKEEVPLASQLSNKTKERSSVLAQIERERVFGQ